MGFFLLGQASNLNYPLKNPLIAQFFHPLSYKFIVLDLLGLFPNSFEFGLQFVTLQLFIWNINQN